MAWAKASELWEYKYTKGDHFVVSQGKISNATWQRLRDSDPPKKVYEEVLPMDAQKSRNHIVVYDSVQEKAVDSQVPELARKANCWDSVMQLVPGFTKEMLLVADLMYRVEYLLTLQLNSILEAGGLGRVDHVMQALHRVENKFLGKEEKDALNDALLNFFTLIGGSNVAPSLLMKQWATCRDWQCKRVSFAHPLQQLGTLEDVKSKVKNEKGFEQVRDIALIMVDVAMENELIT